MPAGARRWDLTARTDTCGRGSVAGADICARREIEQSTKTMCRARGTARKSRSNACAGRSMTRFSGGNQTDRCRDERAHLPRSRAVREAAPSLYPGLVFGSLAFPPRRATRKADDYWGGSERAPPAFRLPFSPALPARNAALRSLGAGAEGGRAAPRCRLPPVQWSLNEVPEAPGTGCTRTCAEAWCPFTPQPTRQTDRRDIRG